MTPDAAPDGAVAVLALLQLVVAAGLLVVGRWGAGASERLAPIQLDPQERAARAVTYRRGALTCRVLGVVVALAGLATAVSIPF